jgi:hypothetical protein
LEHAVTTRRRRKPGWTKGGARKDPEEIADVASKYAAPSHWPIGFAFNPGAQVGT